MTVHITKKLEGPELEHIFLEAAYSGERFLMEGDEGFEIAIVPREDLLPCPWLKAFAFRGTCKNKGERPVFLKRKIQKQ